jgi:energy-coupling factor transporter transmembrane protein EcfT
MIAQTSRGINTFNGTLKEKIISFKNSLVPILILSFKRSNDISLSMTIRDYKPKTKRTRFVKNKFNLLEFISLLFVIALLVVIILMRINLIKGT